MSFQRMTAWQGCEFVDSAKTNKRYYGFVVNTEAVISVLSGLNQAGETVNYLSTIGLSGKTLAVGTLIVVPEGEVITSITPASGSVVAYK